MTLRLGDTPSKIDEEGYVATPMIYAGWRLDAKNEKFIVFYPTNPDKKPVTFSKATTIRRFKYAVIGGIYELWRKEDYFKFTTVFLSESKDERVPAWKTEQDVCQITLRKFKEQEKLKKEVRESLSTVLRPYHEIWQRSDTFGRRALEALVIHSLQTGKD